MNENIREIYYSDEYEDYLDTLPKKVREKYDYIEKVIKTNKGSKY